MVAVVESPYIEIDESPSKQAGQDETSNEGLVSALRADNERLKEMNSRLNAVLNLTLDDFDDFVNETERKANANKPAVKLSRIRVWISRPLTYAEIEQLTTDHTTDDLSRINDSGLPLKLRVAKNREHVWVDGALSSRVLYELIAATLETHFVNVYPKAVRTFHEYNGE